MVLAMTASKTTWAIASVAPSLLGDLPLQATFTRNGEVKYLY